MNTQTTATLNLYQRLRATAESVGLIVATGRNQYSAVAVSISDVENAIRDELAKHGVITRWAYVSLQQLEKTLWQAHLRVTLVNADDSNDRAEDDWIDVGTNPMAATSFARKGYYKALFHLASADDDQIPGAANNAPAQRAPATNGTSKPKAKYIGLCSLCAEEQLKANGGKDAGLFQSPDGRVKCNGRREDGTYANHGLPEPTATDAGDVDPSEIPF